MKTKITYIIIVSLLALQGYSQQNKINKASDKYEKYAYIDAIKTYERIVEKGYKSEEILKKLGDSYYFNGKLVEANQWYEQLYAMNTELEQEYLYRYAQSLKATEKYEDADKILNIFHSKNGQDNRGILHNNQSDYLKLIKKNANRYEISNAGINSEYSDYGAAFYKDQIVFTSARDTGNLTKRKHTWTGDSFTNLYSAQVDQNGSLSSPEKFSKKLKSKFNESTPVFTKDGKKVYFTRNNFIEGKKGKDDQKRTLLKIYSATLDNEGNWTNITELPFNSDKYNVAHPALSPDEKTLYFASDMPGTLGKSDLFKVAILTDDSYGIPENLGPEINTEGRESFPFISENNELYFASDGHPGLGGLDVFAVKFNDDDTFTKPQNIGEGVNSPFDDFAYVINNETKRGFFTSNRKDGIGNDDIYKFLEIKKLEFIQEHTLEGLIFDEETEEYIANANVTLLDENFEIMQEVKADENGYYTFEKIAGNQKVYIRTSKEEYNTVEKSLDIPNTNGKTSFNIGVQRSVKRVKVGDDLAKTFGIKIIYFDLDKWNIRPDAAVDLAKIVDVLKENPTMKVDVRSHTDSRQTHKYNEVLSERRAKSTMNWMIKDGIDPSRLTGKGYGETQLVNECADGVECSEEQHQRNRRSEFIITAL